MAIYAEDDCKAAWLTKVSALHAVSRHDEALADMTALKTMYEGDEVVKHWHEQADFKARKAKRPDYYQVCAAIVAVGVSLDQTFAA